MRKQSKINSARALRGRMTDTERKMWYLLRDRRLMGCKFRRQHPVGPYIADFVCLEHRLVVELEGSQHADDPHQPARDAFLAAQGYRVLRFWNNEALKGSAAVCETVARALSPEPSPRRLRGQAEGC